MAKEQVLTITLVRVDDDGESTFNLKLGGAVAHSILVNCKRRGLDPTEWLVDAIEVALEVARVERDAVQSLSTEDGKKIH